MRGRPRRERLKRKVFSSVLLALDYIDEAHKTLSDALKYERINGSIERNDLFDYGLSDVNFHKVKLANIKKAILSITSNSHSLA